MKKLLLACMAALTALMPLSAERKEMKKVNFPEEKTGLADVRTLGKQHAHSMRKAQKAVPTVAPALYEGRTFHANLISSDAWAGASITSVPYGVYTYTLGDGAEFEALSTDLGYNFMSSVYARDQLVGVYPMSMMGLLNGVRYLGLSAPEFKTSWEVVYEAVSYGYIPTTMAYNPTDDKTYAVMYNDALNGMNWAVFDKANRRFNTVQEWANDFQPVAMAATPDGRLFCIGLDGGYYELDKATGDASMLGEVGVMPVNYVQAMGYDGRTATFLWCAVTTEGSALYAVDVESGATSKVADLTENEQVSSLFFMESEAPDKAPAAIADLDIAYAADGALNGNITFTVPAQAYDGSTLSGNMDMTLYIDGEVKESKSVAPEAKQTYPVSLANGNHYVYVSLENEAGFSPYNFVYEYAGYDVPKGVTDLVLEISDAGESKLTWSAPAGGVNNGYIDYDNLTYTVVRMPEGITVATDLKTTAFTETCPVDMARYSYQVIPHNGADKQGEAAVSNQVLYGSAFSIPYHDDFATDETMTFYSFYHDVDKKDTLGYYNASQHTVDLKPENTRMITPLMAMEAGKAYCATYTMRNSFGADSVEIFVGTDLDDMESFRLVNTIDSMQTIDHTYYDPFESDFVIDVDGDYHLAVVGRKEWIFIKQIDVVEIGSKDAPAAPTALVVAPEESGEMKATLTFVVPTQTMAGDDLTGALTAHIYLDNATEAAGTLSGLAAGATATWTDESVEGAVGKHSYTVRMANAAGEGKWTTAEAFIGVYEPTYTNTFDTKESTEFFVTENLDNQTGNECRWKWNQYNKNLELFYSVANPVEKIRLYMPAFKFDENSVYEVSFAWKNSVYGAEIPAYLTVGMQPNAEAQTDTVASLPMTDYTTAHLALGEVVTGAAGKYYPSVLISGDAATYLMPTIDSVVVKYITSASAPYAVENLKVEHDPEGKLKADLSFSVPTTDFAGRTLTENVKVDIFRGTDGVIPVKTFNGVTPGAELEWTDDEPQQGMVTYLIVASNAAGRGKETLASTYVGIDVPQAVTGYVVKGDADNTGVELSWTAPETGVNGGVLGESLSYVVVELFPLETDPEKQMAILGTTQETSFTQPDVETDAQALHYYGVITTTSTGIGQAVLDEVVLGKPYDLPFRESFANGAPSTSTWVIGSENTQAAAWYAGQDDDNFSAQDGDNGFALFINGVMMGSTYYRATFTTPKFRLAAEDNTLSFYVYHGIESANDPLPSLSVLQNINDGDYTPVSEAIVIAEGTPGWKQYTVELQTAPDARYSTVQFLAGAHDYTEWILMDNIVVSGGTSDVAFVAGNEGWVCGLEGAISFNGLDGQAVQVYDISGVRIASFTAAEHEVRCFVPGVYVVSYAGKACKVMVR